MLNKILSQLDQLSTEELSTLNNAVVRMARAKSRMNSIKASATLKVGQEVEIDQVKHRGQKFIIKKVNRTKCVITGPGGTYNCPMSMLIA